MLKPLQKTTVVEKLVQTVPDLLAIYIFGSQADGTARADSDTDLAFLSREKLDPNLAFHLKGELSVVLKTDVDLVDLWRADTVTQAQVVAFGERLYAKRRAEIDLFENTVFSKYAILNEERREIITDIIQRGSIRG